MQIEKPTYAKQWRKLAEQMKQQVCQLLDWDEMQYAEFQYTSGLSYLMWLFPVDEHARDCLQRSKVFWNWYKHTWSMYDESYLTYRLSLKENSAAKRTIIYKDLHCPRTMAVEVKPNSVVIAEINKKEEAYV